MCVQEQFIHSKYGFFFLINRDSAPCFEVLKRDTLCVCDTRDYVRTMTKVSSDERQDRARTVRIFVESVTQILTRALT